MITDARHDSTCNAYHTTVPCLSARFEKVFQYYTHYFTAKCIFFSTKRIIGICTKSRSEHITAQTRELECTKTVIPSVMDDLGNGHKMC